MDAESIRSQVHFRFSRSSGPGGQHAQKSATRVEALFDVETAAGLTDSERRRVLALTMPGLLDDLDGLQLVGMNVDAVLLGGADEGEETGRIFSYLNLNRAFHELEAGAELYCLHKNRWWQTSDGARLDAGAFVAGLEYAAETEATVLGKPSSAYFAAALEALDADPSLKWMVGDDIEGDIVGAHNHGLRTVLVRTGKFRPDDVERSRVQPDGIVSSIAQLPDWLEQNS